jgi:hypothetical protein
MRSPSALVRSFVTCLAIFQAFAPGIASLVDARPAAMSVVQQYAPHVEQEGAGHALRAHVDDCSLCQLATRNIAERPATSPLIASRPRAFHLQAGPAPYRELLGAWSAPSRAPPVG